MLRETVDVLGGTTSGGVDAADIGLEPFDLHLMLGEAAKKFADPAREKGLALEVKTGATVPAEAIGDATRLRAALFGLIDNAVKFTEQGEIVTSVTAEQTPGGRALLHAEVSDTGVGVPSETMARLFDESRGGRLAKADDGTNDGGLPTACRLIELMDGQFGCSSAVGMGTTVWFTVPLDLPA